MQFAAAIAADGNKAYICRPTQSDSRHSAESDRANARRSLTSGMNFFTLVKAVVEMALSSGQGVAEHVRWHRPSHIRDKAF